MAGAREPTLAGRAAWAVERTRELLAERAIADLHGGDLAMNLVLTEAEATRAAGASDPAAWSAAIELWEGRGRVFEPAYARYRRAEALLAAGGRRAEAADDLRVAAVAGGVARRRAPPAHGRGARRAGADRARRNGPEAADGDDDAALRLPSPLTRREHEVLALLAEGRSNRQIADTLFISESTAGVHVSNILGKLGVSGRTEAAAVAFRAGLVPATGDVGG